MRKLSLLLMLLLPVLLACKQGKTYYLTQGEVFKTQMHVKYCYERDLGREIYALLDTFDLILNPFNPQSNIYRINHNETAWADPRLVVLIERAEHVSRISSGSYDITCAPFINLWGFGYERHDSISPAVIDSLRQFVGYQKIAVRDGHVWKEDSRVQMNPSSIAKGYAVDLVALYLQSLHIEDYMVEIGGEIRVHGRNPSGNSWSIEILQPIDDASGQIREKQEIIRLDSGAIATSGNYRNYYIRDGRKYAHIIDPQTGYPSQEGILSASVLYPDCMMADAYATAFMAMGVERAAAVADTIPALEYLFVYSDESGKFVEKRSVGFGERVKK
jgi:thiamine biosynthesis lipoprotein